MQPPWRNRLARSAVNRKVGGSSPPGGVRFKDPSKNSDMYILIYMSSNKSILHHYFYYTPILEINVLFHEKNIQ